MSHGGPLSPQAVPTLTEVVDWPDQTRPPEPVTGPGSLDESTVLPAGVAPPPPMPTEEQMSQRVLADLQHQIDLMLEYRLRELLTPLLQRAADSVVRDARGELASTLREIVARAVAQELARHRDR